MASRNKNYSRAWKTPLLTDRLCDPAYPASSCLLTRNKDKITSTHKPFCEDEIEHSKALTTWIWTNVMESQAASVQAFPVTSEQPDLGVKPPSKVRTRSQRNS